MSAVNRRELIDELSRTTGIPIHLVRRVVVDCFDSIKKHVEKGSPVRVQNFGTFSLEDGGKPLFKPSKNYGERR